MIRTERGLAATRESLHALEEALLGLTRTKHEYHPATFELLAAPIREEILARRAEIDEYIGMTPGPLATTPHQLEPESAPARVMDGLTVETTEPSPNVE